MQNEFVCLKAYLDDTQDLLVGITHSDRNQFCECVSGFFTVSTSLCVAEEDEEEKI